MDLLKLVHFTILGVGENEHDFQIKVETNSPPSSCPHCGCVPNLYKHSNREQLCMDLPIHGKRGNITKLYSAALETAYWLCSGLSAGRLSTTVRPQTGTPSTLRFTTPDSIPFYP
ncbi:transposase family protein [Bacillus cereus]|uniref:transposase family protein n=1 Tax=Paenibacillus melissococcoides TaxID=2912268 RepID=UPI001BCC4DB8|nr:MULTISPECIES: transposase family protein [Paenibacillus]MEB9896492.1 transposase family protein [Bacillus cereus]CAH8721233.1 transposase family protein [Paenibacillus melissococcoides]